MIVIKPAHLEYNHNNNPITKSIIKRNIIQINNDYTVHNKYNIKCKNYKLIILHTSKNYNINNYKDLCMNITNNSDAIVVITNNSNNSNYINFSYDDIINRVKNTLIIDHSILCTFSNIIIIYHNYNLENMKSCKLISDLNPQLKLITKYICIDPVNTNNTILLEVNTINTNNIIIDDFCVRIINTNNIQGLFGSITEKNNIIDTNKENKLICTYDIITDIIIN